MWRKQRRVRGWYFTHPECVLIASVPGRKQRRVRGWYFTQLKRLKAQIGHCSSPNRKRCPPAENQLHERGKSRYRIHS